MTAPAGKSKTPEKFAISESIAARFAGATAEKNPKDRDYSLAALVTGNIRADHVKLRDSINKGLKFSSITRLGNALDLAQKDVANLLSITPSTLNRRKKEGLLQPDESDRVVRFARLKDAALNLMQGDDQAAITWLRTPLEVLAGESPLNYARTEIGAKDVEDLIGRIRYGVFS